MKFETLINTFNNISDDIELFLAEKNFIMDVYDNCNYKDIVDNIRKFRNRDITLAYLYTRLIDSDSDKIIKLMGKYIKLNHSRGVVDLSPIQYFLQKKDATDYFKAHKKDFLTEVYPIIWELNLFKKLADIGIVITLLDIEYPEIGEKIMIKILDNAPIFLSIDNQINSELINYYYLTNKITPFPVMRDIDEMIKSFEINVSEEVEIEDLEENTYDLCFGYI